MLRHNVIYMIHTLEHFDVTVVYLSLSYSRSLMVMALTFFYFKLSTIFIEIISDSSNILKQLVFNKTTNWSCGDSDFFLIFYNSCKC